MGDQITIVPNPHFHCSWLTLTVVFLPNVPNPAAVLAAVVAAVRGVCRIQPDVCAGVQAAGGIELAGCAVLDDPAACDRRQAGPQFDQAVFDFRVLRGVWVSDLGCGAGCGHDLQPAREWRPGEPW